MVAPTLFGPERPFLAFESISTSAAAIDPERFEHLLEIERQCRRDGSIGSRFARTVPRDPLLDYYAGWERPLDVWDVTETLKRVASADGWVVTRLEIGAGGTYGIRDAGSPWLSRKLQLALPRELSVLATDAAEESFTPQFEKEIFGLETAGGIDYTSLDTALGGRKFELIIGRHLVPPLGVREEKAILDSVTRSLAPGGFALLEFDRWVDRICTAGVPMARETEAIRIAERWGKKLRF